MVDTEIAFFRLLRFLLLVHGVKEKVTICVSSSCSNRVGPLPRNGERVFFFFFLACYEVFFFRPYFKYVEKSVLSFPFLRFAALSGFENLFNHELHSCLFKPFVSKPYVYSPSQ